MMRIFWFTKKVFHYVGLLVGILGILFVVTMAITFFSASGLVSKADSLLGTGTVSELTATGQELAATTSGALFDIGKALPGVGPMFEDLQMRANSFQEQAANVGSTVGGAIDAAGNALGSVAGGVGEVVGEVTGQ